MNKFYGGILAAFFGISGLQAQTLQTNKTQIAFGNATEIALVTQQVTLSNPLSYAVNVKNIRFFTVYGEPAFSTNATFPLTIPAGGSQTLTITFSPLHNIAHNSEMVVETDSRGGNLAIDLTGQGKYSRAYYNNTENLAQDQLKLALKTTISSPYNSFGYNVARDKMYMEIDNWKVNGRGSAVNKLECVYTGRVASGYTDRTHLFNTFNINAEHTYPQGKFNQAEPMRSDIHHLFPTDEAANGSRSSYPFGTATMPYINDAINNPSHLGSNQLYEVRDVQKGPTARAMMYFVIRYQDYQGFFVSQEAILKNWNRNFAPSAVDIKRNDDIQARQLNRNPFVDYPQFAARINNFVSPSSAPVNYELYHQGMINFGVIPPNTSHTFHYVLVNNGNQTMNFTNPTLSTTGKVSFAPGSGTNFSIAPGEAHTLRINGIVVAGDSINETLTFGSNIPGKTTITVPVYANKKNVQNPLGVSKATEKYVFNLFPNPVTEELTIARGNQFGAGVFQFEIIDALGKTVLKANSREDISTVNVSGLQRGVYFLRIRNGAEWQTKRFVKI